MNANARFAFVGTIALALGVVAMQLRVGSVDPSADLQASAAAQGAVRSRSTTVSYRRDASAAGVVIPPMVGDTESTSIPAPRRPERSRVESRAATTFRRPGDATPRSVQVISVPVPKVLGRGVVTFNATPSGRADLISAHAGTLTPTPDAEGRATTLVTRIPSGAAAGPLEVAQVRFTNDSVTTTVAVELVVARVHRVVLRPTRNYVTTYSGERIAIEVLAQNHGNGPDSIRLAADLPSRWRGAPSAMVILQPGEQRTIRLDLRAAPLPATGSVPLRLFASSSEGELASVVLPVELIEDRATIKNPTGPTLVAGLATATGDSIGRSPVLGLAIDGPLAQGIKVRGRLVHPTDDADFNSQAMGRIGYFRGSSYLNLAGDRWSVTGGRTGQGFSPLFGWNLFGLGASAELNTGGWAVAGTVVEERFNGASGGGHMGLNLSHALGAGRLSAVLVRMDQQISVSRRLHAVGLSYTISPREGMRLTGEAGYRSSGAGSGPAVSAEIQSRGARGQWSLYAGHAPGGSYAFARATDEVNAAVWRRLTTKLSWRASGFGSSNEAGNGRGTRAHGASTGTALSVNAATTVDLQVGLNSNESDNPLGTTGSRDLLATLGGRSRFGNLTLNASIGGGQTTRTTVLASGVSSDRTGGRLLVRGGADAYTSRGSFTLDASLERNSSFTGAPLTIAAIGVNGSQVRLFSSNRAPRLNVAAWINAYDGAPSNGAAVRIGTEIFLPGDFLLAVDAERNPYTRTSGSTPWIAAFRIERALGLPGVRRASARGQVFDDVNGNGTRDGSERGLAGVLVRRGEQSILTDQDGSFRFYDDAPRSLAPTVNMASLELGQLPSTARDGRGGREWTLPVVRTERLEVVLVPTADSLGRTPVTRLDMLAAIATDSTGATWIARADSLGRAVFDALPAGRYTITPDLSGSPERIRSLESAQSVEVRPGQIRQVVRLPFGFRAARVFDGGAGTGGGRRR